VDVAADNPGNGGRRTLGERLAAERERQALSRADVAQRLHMSPWQIEALEVGDYQRLPKGTFLRGFVRNYAKLLGLAPDEALALLAEGAPRQSSPGIVVPTQNIRFDPLGERLSSPYVKAAALAVVAVSIGFAAMYWAMFVRPATSRVHKATTATQAPAAPAPAAPRVAAPTNSPAPGPAATPPAASAPAASPSPASVPPAAAKASPAPADGAAGEAQPAPAKAPVKAGAKLVHFHFAGDSWVEVRDARGKVIFQRLNAAGTEAEVAGRPPLDVVVGNAPEVQVTYDGRDFPLEPHTNVAVARFTLE